MLDKTDGIAELDFSRTHAIHVISPLLDTVLRSLSYLLRACMGSRKSTLFQQIHNPIATLQCRYALNVVESHSIQVMGRRDKVLCA